VSSIPDDRHVVEAPARVFDAQEDMLAAFKAGELDRDVVCVVRWQGLKPTACQMHKLTPPLAMLQGKGSGWRWSQTGTEAVRQVRCRRRFMSHRKRAAGGPGQKCAQAMWCAWTR
jgi:hypothetical protein